MKHSDDRAVLGATRDPAERTARPIRLRAVLMVTAASLGLAGCYGDPFQNPGDWSATGATRENLAQQVADKSELIEGHGAATSNGVAAVAAVNLALGGQKGDAAGLQAPPKTISFSSGSGS